MFNWPEWLNTQKYIGSQYPYFSSKYEQPFFSFNFNEVLSISTTERPVLEVQSVIEILMRGYILGDKTLVKDIYRAPWMAEYNVRKNNWHYFEIPPHDNRIMDPKEAAITFKNYLYHEILSFIGSAKKVGILLSGGMDSRILAGILKETQLNKDFEGEVIVYNWGIRDSRDVWYAKKIAEIYNWVYKRLTLDPQVLKDNFYLVQKIGAETSPFNLHAMNAVAKDKDSDIILAGSYGDTLGRAEYNGTPLKEAPPITFKNANKLSLLKDQVVKEYYGKMKKESISYRNTVDNYERKEYQYRETEYQRHHTRRHLSTAMSIIALEKPIYQLFTSPKVVRFLWSLDLSIRSDVLYKNILPLLPGKIDEIPWARTGQIFGNIDGESLDNGLASSHEYSKWLNHNLKDFIAEELDMNILCELGIFNEKSLDNIYRFWLKSANKSIMKIDTTISWLTVLSIFINTYNVKTQNSYKNNIHDKINAMTVVPKIQGYQKLRNNLK